MSDITESLRALTVNDATTSTLAVCEAAAREIERLQAEREQLINDRQKWRSRMGLHVGSDVDKLAAEIERLREQNESLRNTLRFIAVGRIRDDCAQGIERADSFAVGRMSRLARDAVREAAQEALNQPRREEQR